MTNFELKKTTIFLFTTLLFSQLLFSQPKLSYTSKITGLSSPVDIVNAGDGTNRVFVVQKGGIIKVYSKGATPPGNLTYIKDFLTVTGLASGSEEGLLSLAFPPNYSTNGYFFVYYVNSGGNLVLARYHVSATDPNLADPTTREIVLTISHPTNANHNGAKLIFRDGFLYFATGDGGGSGDASNNAQNINSLLGKMLRITVNTTNTGPLYTSPSDNPYAGAIAGADEIYAIGLRNPWRWSFDRANGNMWIADVGQGAWEEINFRTPANAKGVNYGWRCYEGAHVYPFVSCSNDSTNPVFDYPHSNATGGYSVTGGYVYRGTEYSNLVGWYICADYISGNLFRIYPKPNNAGWFVYMQAQSGPPNLPVHISTFGEAEDGTLYAASLDGAVYKMDLVEFSPLPVRLAEFTLRSSDELTRLYWRTSFEENLSRFEVEYSTDGVNFQWAGSVVAANEPSGANYTFSHSTSYNGKVFYRLKMINLDNSAELSGIISVDKTITGKNFVRPSLITTGVISVYLNDDTYKTAELIGVKGDILTRQNINGRTGRIDIPVSFVSPGTYIVQLRNNESAIQQKVIIR